MFLPPWYKADYFFIIIINGPTYCKLILMIIIDYPTLKVTYQLSARN